VILVIVIFEFLYCHPKKVLTKMCNYYNVHRVNYTEEIDMDSIGKYLKERRESLSLSIEEVSNETKLKTYIIEQIERDDFAAIADVGFSKIMVVTYCRALQGDVDQVLKRLNQIFDQPSEPPIKINTVKPIKPVILPNNLIWFISLFLLIGVLTYAFIYLYKDKSFSWDAIRKQLAATPSKEVVNTQQPYAEPDTVLISHKRVFEESINTSVAEPPNETNISTLIEPDNEAYGLTGMPLIQSTLEQTTREVSIYLKDKTDYVSNLIFNGKISPLNPEI